MKKHNQKFFSFLLIVAMMLSLVTSVAFADGASAESVQTQETNTVVQPAPVDVPVPAESSPTAVAPAADNGDATPTPAVNPVEEPSTPPAATPAVDEQGGAPTADTPADNAPTGDTPTGDTPTGDAPTGDTPATTAPVEEPQPSVEPTPVAEDVPSPAAQAFISAVAAISVPETLTEDTYAVLSAQVDAAYAALEALSTDDLARADVHAAIAALASVAEVLAGGIDVLTPLYKTLYVDCVVNGEVVKTITLTSGDMYIQVDMQVPYLSALLNGTKWEKVDYGRVTAVKCSPPAYFPSGLDLHEGQNIQLSNNHQRYQLIYSTSGWVDGSSSTNPGDIPSGKFVLVYNKNCNDTVTNMPANYIQDPTWNTTLHNMNIDPKTPARAGYTFTGWNTAANGTGTALQPNQHYVLYPNQPITLYAQWTKNTPATETATAALKYDANGGTGAPADQTATVAKGTYADFLISSTIPTKDDSTFKGWCDDKDGNGITYKAGQYIGVLAGSTTTLYAQWEKNTITLTYDDGVDDGSVSNLPAAETKTKGTDGSATFKISSQIPVRNGYTFKGWIIGSLLMQGVDEVSIKSDTTAIAKWEKNSTSSGDDGGDDGGDTGDTLTLTYDDGVDDGSVSNLPKPQTATKGENGYAKFTISSQIPTRSGYTFKGWALDGLTLQPGAEFSRNADATVTAIWELNSSGGDEGGDGGDDGGDTGGDSGDTLTLTYDDGVDDDSVSNLPKPQTATKGENGYAKFTISSQIPTRSGYTFKGWDLDGLTLQPGADFSRNADATVTAIWEKNSSGGDEGGDGGDDGGDTGDTLTLTYDDGVDDGSVSNLPAPDTKTKDANGYVNFTISSTTPTRSGFTFKGWKLDENRTLQASEKLGTNVDVTVTAIWELNSSGGGDDGGDSGDDGGENPSTLKATLNYDANGGTGAPTGETKDADKETGAEFIVSGTVPTWDNHSFASWNTAANGTGASYKAGDKVTVKAGETTTLYAQWELIPSGGDDDGGNTDETKATIKYFGNYGTFSGGSTYITDTKDADKEKGADFIITSTVPTLTEFTFEKWTTNVDGSGTSYKAGDKVTVKAGETLNLFAQWKHNTTGGDSLTLTYVGGVDDSSVSNLPAAQTEKKDADGKVTFTVSTQIPTRSGFTFKGWKLGDATLASGASFTTSADVTLTATWEKTSSGEVVTTPDWSKLTVAKSVYPYRPVVVGETLVYTITVTNNTGSALSYVTVYEALDSHLTFMSASCTANTTYNAATGIWAIDGLANGASATLVVYAKVNYGTPVNTVIYNTASIGTAVSQMQEVIPDNSRNSASANLVVYNGNCYYYNSAYPKTGDDAQTGLWLALMVLSLVCVGVAVVSAKKKVKNR